MVKMCHAKKKFNTTRKPAKGGREGGGGRENPLFAFNIKRHLLETTGCVKVNKN